MLPKISCGLLLYKKQFGNYNFLLVKRKTSYTFWDIITNRFDGSLKIENLTDNELKSILNYDLESLIMEFLPDNVYYNTITKNNIDTYKLIQEKIKKCNNKLQYNIDYQQSTGELCIWELPKGCLKKGESFFDCANREFVEETKIKDYLIKSDAINYIFMGTDKKLYRYIIYLAEYQKNIKSINIENNCDELGDFMKWYDLNSLMNIKNSYVSKFIIKILTTFNLDTI